MKAGTFEHAWSDFPALDLVRTSRFVRFCGKLTMYTLILSVIAMLFVPWQQTATGTGIVLALDPQLRPQAVKSAAKEGIVSWVKEDLREGAYVEKDTILIRLEPTAADGVELLELQLTAITLQIEAITNRIDFTKQQFEMQKTAGQFEQDGLEKEIEGAFSKWEQAQKDVSALEEELVDKRTQRNIAEEVAREGIIPAGELVTKRQKQRELEQKVLKAKNAVSEAFANLEAKKKYRDAKLEEIQIKIRDWQNKLEVEQEKLNKLEKDRIDLKVKQQAQDRLTITAPRSGYIQQWNSVERSDTVKEGQQVCVIVPEADELAVEMQISGNDMPLVHVGDRVRLQFEGWPAVQFVGWPSVAIGSFGGKVHSMFPTDDGKGNFKVLITPDNHFEREDGWPDETYLRQGVRTNGWVLLRPVPLGYEIWRQLNAFPPALDDPKEEGNKEKSGKIKLPKS